MWCWWNTLPAWAAEPLSQFFSAHQIEELQAYRQDFGAATTAGDVAELYRRALTLEKTLLAPIREAHQTANWPLLDHFREAEAVLPGLKPACEAECTEPAFLLLLADFLDAASKTASPADDAFFHLLHDVYPYPLVFYGELTGWPVFFEQTWDYGGYSLLGSGSHFALLLRIDVFTAEYDLFGQEIGDLRGRLMTDLLEHSRCSALPAADILEEIDRILRQVTLQETDAEKISHRRTEFQDPAKHGIEVDCRQALCSCGSG